MQSYPPGPEDPWPSDPQRWSGQQPQYQYPAQPVWSAPPAQPPARPRFRLFVLIGLALALALAAASVFIAFQVRSASAATVAREPVNTASNPFFDPVGQDKVGIAAPAKAGGTFAGDTPGLYGGTKDNASCDAQKMIDFLAANPDKATAWAAVVGIRVGGIGPYIKGLTSMILRSDTAVTNHGYSGGKATTLTSILQAGTAVFVDDHGAPVVKCYCGNPLTRYVPKANVSYTGPSWAAFNPTQITVIQQSTVIIEKYTVIDLNTGQPFVRAPGSTPNDKPLNDPSPSPSESSQSPTPVPTTRAPTTQAPQYTSQDAINLLSSRVRACEGVAKYPWPPHKSLRYATKPVNSTTWQVTIYATTQDDRVETFIWNVSPAAKTVTPANGKAAEAARYCPGLAR
jgi:hypothetical protein